MSNLPESIPSTNIKVIELYNKIDSEVLNMSPDFQRKLVWKKQHKFHFIETMLMNYPFPEVYIASSEIDVTSIKSTEVVVDGQQRLSTIVDYIKGLGDFSDQIKIPKFIELSPEKKKDFLNYIVSVRDLKDIGIDVIKDVFQRINNTEYSLNAIEKANAQYGDGEFVIFNKQLIDGDYEPNTESTDCFVQADTRAIITEFFNHADAFTDNDSKRMNDLQYSLTLVSTLLEGDYFGRNTKANYYMKEYNDGFDRKDEVEEKLLNSISIYNQLEFDSSSYWFFKPNLFTLMFEFSSLELSLIDIPALKSGLNKLASLYSVYFSNENNIEISAGDKKYFEFAREGVNEKAARVYRSKIIQDILGGCIRT